MIGFTQRRKDAKGDVTQNHSNFAPSRETLRLSAFASLRETLRESHKKRPTSLRKSAFNSGGGRIRTCDLRVMSPTSYQLLHPAMW